MNKDEEKSREQLIRELVKMRLHVTELKESGRELKRLEEDLKRARDLAEDLIQTANLLIVELDLQGNLNTFNRTAEEITGYTVDELKGKNWFKVMVPREHYEHACAEFARLLAGRIAVKGEYPILTRSGEERYIAWRNNVIVRQDDMVKAISFGMDITERKKAEKALRESEEKYRDIFDHATIGMFRTSPGGGFIDANPAVASIFGYDSPEDLMKRVTHVGTQLYVDPETRKKWISSINKQDYADFEAQMRKKDGSACWVRQSGRAVRNAEGKVICYEGFSEDITERKEVEEALRWKTALLEAQMNTSTDGILVVNENQKRILINRRLVDLLAIPQYVLNDEDDAALRSYIAGLVRHPEPFMERVEYLYHHPYQTSRDEIEFKDGMVLERYSAPVLDEHGFHYGRIWKFRDVTERKRAEEALKQSEELYRTIFENTGTATVVLEKDVINLVNTEYEKLSGYRREEIEGKRRWTEFVVKEDLERLLKKIGPRRRAAKTVQMKDEFRFIDRNGQLRNVALCFDRIPGTKKTIASLLDITDRKRNEETLRESQRELADIIEFFPDATMIIDKEGKITAWNRAMETLTGVKAEGMLGKGNYEYALPFHGSRKPILIDYVLNRQRSGNIGNGYMTFQNDRGILLGEGLATNLPSGDRYCSAKAAALHDSRGETIAAIECIRDITEQKKIEARLNRAEKMEALGTLAGGVAHDLNNVLGVLVGYAELLVAKLPESSPLIKYARHILQSSEKGAAIIQDLLTLARRGVTVSEVVNLNKVIADYLESPEYEKLISYHGDVLVRRELEAELYNIKGSPVHLGKSVMNLISNAVESISDLGTVTIRTENRYVDYPISGYDDVQEGDYVIFSVTDTGSGIPARDVGKIFEPFYTKKIMGRSGTGLGLAVVWGTVKDHQGYIEVKSGEGVGSTFTLYFPVTREELIREGEKTDLSLCRGQGELILVIDDMEFQRELAATMLSTLNYNVSTVSSGEAAVAYLRNHQADLLLLDMIMDPGIDGLETFRRIQEIRPHQKAIIVSGFAETERVRMAQELGAGEYVRKPYNLEKIGLAIRRELERTER